MKKYAKFMFLFLILAIFIVGCGKKEEIIVEPEPVVVQEPTIPDNVITVCKDGSCDYSSISAAVDIAESGEEVRVMDKGTYLDEEIVLDVGGIIVDCGGATLNGERTGTAFFFKESNNNEVKNCVIKNYAHAVNMDRANNNKILNNKMIDSGRGLYMKGSSNNEIKNNEMTGNKLGMEFYVCEGNVIEGNTVTNSVASGITDTNSQTGNSYVNNIVKDNGKMGIWIKSENIVLTGNQFTNNGYDGILCGAKTITMTGNTCSGNEKDQCKGCPVDSCTELSC